MAKYKEKYHQAAKDGYLDMLREATRKDCDSRDDVGRTPVAWSAFYGHLDALRILLSRGGDANLCDFLGNTPLHLAAANGHLPCASFLVNFGASIWNLDNDLHSPLDLAVMNDHKEVIDYLDSVVAKQSNMNRKVTKKLQQRAVLEAEKRRVAFDKMQEKARKRGEKEEAKRKWQREKMAVVPDGAPRPSLSPSSSAAVNDADDRRSSKSAFSTTAGVARKIVKKKSGENGAGSQRGSADFRVSETRSGGGRSVRSLAGLRATTDTEVLYVSNNSATNNVGAPTALQDNPDVDDDDDAGLFVRPGFGSVAFLSKQNVSNVSQALLSLPNNENDSVVEDDVDGGGKHPRSCADSIGTARSLMKRMATLPWSEEDVENLDDDAAGSELELFLACHNLSDVMSVLNKEKIDLEALMLCSEEDLSKIGLPLGPRKKILDAVEKRRMTLQNPGCMKDTYF